MTRYNEFTVPAFIMECGKYIGMLRNRQSKDISDAFKQYDRGAKNESVNILGAQGELAFMYFLSTQGIAFTTPELVSDRPIHAADLVAWGRNVDVKTVRHDAKELLVNEEAHLKNKGIHIYAFVQLWPEGKARSWLYYYNEVSVWPVEFKGFTNAYFESIDFLDQIQKTIDNEKQQE